jgi:hypothetical protein
MASWLDSNYICAYCDCERHLGHLIRITDGWAAFDGTHCSARGDAFRPLGIFPSLAAAKEAVESATVFSRAVTNESLHGTLVI